jgi:hypothetical protein
MSETKSFVARSARILSGHTTKAGSSKPPFLAAEPSGLPGHFFFSQVFAEPHCTKQIEDGVAGASKAPPRYSSGSPSP